ncbi:MAG: ABC transporter ATP-binding protein [Nitriliruptorales bacterium]|nr:ABC transporter ATP-binding protein [Nitriliruptorales bacterium]
MNSIEVADVSKRYRQYRDDEMLLKRLAMPWAVRQIQEITALDGLSFAVERGDTLGIIGRNGSGKTTLLRLLSGVSGPTSGRIRVVGRVAPLIGIGVGFNNELTGRENVFVNGRLLGLTPAQIEDRYESIVAFSELPDFMNVPVKFYSSGMFLRLAFAVAIHTDPDILIVDEILAVGDAGFQAKCDERLRQIRGSGTTIVLVTHNLNMVERMAERTILLDNGRALFDGETSEAIRHYMRLLRDRETDAAAPGVGMPSAAVDVSLLDPDGDPTEQLAEGDPIRVHVRATFAEEVTGVSIGFALDKAQLGVIYANGTDPTAYTATHGPSQPLDASIHLAQLPLKAGDYSLRLVLRATGRRRPLALTAPLHFHVRGRSTGMGVVDFRANFTLNGQPVPAREAGLAGADEINPFE